jgi:nucleoside-diphosphate-sugar epimerase
MRILVTGGSGFIGTNLVANLVREGHAVLNIDMDEPRLAEQRSHFRRVDITDREAVFAAVTDFRPTHVVHLAAVATFEATREHLFKVNVGGTKNVLDALLAAGGVERVVVTSTQYVNGPGAPFDNDTEFHCVNDYGESKKESELLTRRPEYAPLNWVIVRPSNIWGPHHPRFPQEMWRYLRKRLYLHPGSAPIIRAYGYVENIIAQIKVLLTAPAERVRHRLFYLTDEPLDSHQFLNAFSLALSGRPVHQVPRAALRTLALVGDVISTLGVKVPFSTPRYTRMTQAHLARYEKIWSDFGYQPVPLGEAVERTAVWLRQTYPNDYAR